jgi:putative membrane protein
VSWSRRRSHPRTTTPAARSRSRNERLSELDKLTGPAFDKAYVEHEVAYHKAVNVAFETQLIPSASNPLKNLLQTGLKIFQGHQQPAKHVAADLK